MHDSVLQTLALIRKAADDPREVSRLARTQERELRGWLYAPAGAGGEPTFAGALEQAAAEVEEDARRSPVEVVVVGDCPTAPAAARARRRRARGDGQRRQALRRRRRCRSTPRSAPERVEVFVRDRGSGFDPAAVPADRYGLAQSVVGRMERHGGTRRGAQPRPARAPRSGWRCRVDVSALRASCSSTTTGCSARACGPSSATPSRSSARRRPSPRPSRSSVRTQPDVVLLDVHMPDGGGRAVLAGVGAAGARARASSRCRCRTPPRTSSA